jgi:hypothetical protein
VNGFLSLGEFKAAHDRLTFNAARGSPTRSDYTNVQGSTLCVRAHMLDEVIDTGEAPSEVLGCSFKPYITFTL